MIGRVLKETNDDEHPRILGSGVMSGTAADLRFFSKIKL